MSSFIADLIATLIVLSFIAVPVLAAYLYGRWRRNRVVAQYEALARKFHLKPDIPKWYFIDFRQFKKRGYYTRLAILEGHYEERKVRLETRRGSFSESGFDTQFFMRCASGGFQFEIKRKGLFSFGGDNGIITDPQLNECYRFDTNRKPQFQKLLDDPLKRQLIEISQDFKGCVKLYQGYLIYERKYWSPMTVGRREKLEQMIHFILLLAERMDALRKSKA